MSNSSISITRASFFSPDVYDYAVGAYNLLFAPRAARYRPISQPPTDLRNFEDVYCSAGGCFLVARRQSPGSPGPVGILAFKPYVPRFVDAAGTLRPELIWEGKTVEVVRLFISPECRGQGLAQELIERLVEEAGRDGVEVLYLHTQPFLPGAEELWRKMGWEVLGRDEDEWESIHMVRKL